MKGVPIPVFAALFLAACQPAVGQQIPLDKPFLFSYGTWQDQAKIEGGRAVIGGSATPKGGAGVNFEAAFSNPDWSPVLLIKALPGNTLKTLRLMLGSPGDARATFDFEVPPAGPSALVIPREGASLSAPNASEGPRFAPGQVTQWQLIGDWQGDGPVKVEVEEIRVMAPTAAILALRKVRDERLAREEAERKANEAALRDRYGKISSLSPRVTGIWQHGPQQLTLEVTAGRVLPGGLQPYSPKPGDSIRDENEGKVKRLIRAGKEYGFLIGPRREILNKHEVYEGDPLLDEFAQDPSQFVLSSSDDPSYRSPLAASAVSRKSKPINAAMPSYEMVVRHRIYLEFPKPLKKGADYRLSLGKVNAQNGPVSYKADWTESLAEAVRVNQIGFRPDDPVKMAFLSLWRGTGGAARFASPRFSVVDAKTKKPVFEGKGTLALAADAKERLHLRDDNFSQSEVWHLDFSSLRTPGEYFVVVDQVGRSHPFTIGGGVWTKAFTTQMRGLLNNRSGPALGPPYTQYKKPEDMTVRQAMPITWSRSTALDDNSDLTQLRAKDTGQPANGWGGYHDAGDWNPRRVTHLQVTNASMEILEMFPEKAGVLKWNIPQEFKGPDILIEAKWHLDCFKRLQQADGGVSFGLETEFDPYSGEVSWVQTMPIFAWWPDAWSSWVYAHSAFRFADLVEKHDKKMAQEYRSSALRAMDFAEKDFASRTAAGKKVRWEAIDARNVAALAAYRSTKSPRWHEVFLENSVLKDPEPDLYRWTIAWQGEAAFMYARLPQGLGDEALKVKAREALERKAKIALGYQKGNAFLLAASDPGKPMINGFFTGPHVEDLVRAHYLTRKPEYLEGIVKGALFSAGANPVGTTFTTGVGTTSAMAFKIDQRYTNQPIPEGLTIYGMCDYVVFGGSSFYTWPITWHVSRTAKPDPYSWPIQEALFETWLYPAQLEYTVDQWWPNVYGWGYLAFR